LCRPEVLAKLRNDSKIFCPFWRRWSGCTVNVATNLYAIRLALLRLFKRLSAAEMITIVSLQIKLKADKPLDSAVIIVVNSL